MAILPAKSALPELFGQYGIAMKCGFTLMNLEYIGCAPTSESNERADAMKIVRRLARRSLGLVQLATLFLTIAAILAIAPTSAKAEADGPDYYRVRNVSSDSYLNIREGPGRDHAVIGHIPNDGDGVRNLGCEGGMTLAEFENATEAEREAAARRRWCRIEYDGVTGWAVGWYLAEGSGPAAAAPITGVRWQLVTTPGGPAAGEAWITFNDDGSVSGNGGCNNFFGSVKIDAGVLTFGPFGSTQMACSEQELMEQEALVHRILEGEVTYRAGANQLELVKTSDGSTLLFETGP